MEISSIALLDGYRAILAISALFGFYHSVRYVYRMYGRVRNLPPEIQARIRVGAKQSLIDFLRNEKTEVLKIGLLLVALSLLTIVY